jgi:hypothetical protein
MQIKTDQYAMAVFRDVGLLNQCTGNIHHIFGNHSGENFHHNMWSDKGMTKKNTVSGSKILLQFD